MHESITHFMNNIVCQYQQRKDMTYVFYDGTSQPVVVEDIPDFLVRSREMEEEVFTWCTEYITTDQEVMYYPMYKSFIQTLFNVWVNPTVSEIEQYNKANNLSADLYLKEIELLNIPFYEKLEVNFENALEENDYEIILGSELIERLVEQYDSDLPDEVPIVDWLKPAEIATIQNEGYYVVDRAHYMEPVLLRKKNSFEIDSQSFRVSPKNVKLYLKHILVTKRGFGSTQVVKDKRIHFNHYLNILHYLKLNPHETRATTFHKLMNDDVDPAQPFIEAITDNINEVYISNHQLQTEKDILAFINKAFLLEGMDVEAKSFDRKAILKAILKKRLPMPKIFESPSIKEMHKRMIEKHFLLQ